MKVGEELLGNATGGGAVMLRPIRFHCVGVWILTALPFVYINSWPYVYSVPSCGRLSGTLLFAKVGEYLCNRSWVEEWKYTFNIFLCNSVWLEIIKS